jgi:hypothetical protein
MRGHARDELDNVGIQRRVTLLGTKALSICEYDEGVDPTQVRLEEDVESALTGFMASGHVR